MIASLSRRPWILIVIAFLVFIGAWMVLLNLAARHQPERVPLLHHETPAPHE